MTGKYLILRGAAERIRTSDPRITNALLYRLSYRGVLSMIRKSGDRFSEKIMLHKTLESQ